MIRFLSILTIALFSSCLMAQATLAVSGTLGDDEEVLFLVSIDFSSSGGVATAIEFDVAGDSATEGLSVFMGDVDAVAATGPAGTTDSGDDAGTGSVFVTVTSGMYTNTRQFIISVRSFTGDGPVNFSGDISAPGLDPGAITAQSVLRDDNRLANVARIFNRGVTGRQRVDSAGSTLTHEFMVDFGASAQAITFYFNTEGDIAGTVTLQEVLANGTTSTLTSLSDAGADWFDDDNVTTSARSGVVRFRVVSSTADLRINWFTLFPSSVSVLAFGSFTISGTLTNNQDRFHRFTLDFGANATSYMVQLADGTLNLTGMGNFEIFLVDVNELAQNGPSNAVNDDIEIASMTPQHTGVRQFVYIASHQGTGSATYSVTFEFSTQSVAAAGVQAFSTTASFRSLFNFGVEADHEFAAPVASQSFDFQVNFGAVSQVADFFLSGGGDGTGNVEIFEILGDGTPVSRGVASWTGDDEDNFNGSSSSRTGIVRFRVTINGTVVGGYYFTVIFADNVTVGLIPGESKKKKDSGCSTGDHGSHWLALFGALAVLGLATRLRHARA